MSPYGEREPGAPLPPSFTIGACGPRRLWFCGLVPAPITACRLPLRTVHDPLRHELKSPSVADGASDEADVDGVLRVPVERHGERQAQPSSARCPPVGALASALM